MPPETVLAALRIAGDPEEAAELAARARHRLRDRIERPATKRCAGCEQVLPTSAFHKDRSKAGGFSSACKACS